MKRFLSLVMVLLLVLPCLAFAEQEAEEPIIPGETVTEAIPAEEPIVPGETVTEAIPAEEPIVPEEAASEAIPAEEEQTEGIGAEDPVGKAALETGIMNLVVVYKASDDKRCYGCTVPLGSTVYLDIYAGVAAEFSDLVWECSNDAVLVYQGANDFECMLWFNAARAGTATLTVSSKKDTRCKASVKVTVQDTPKLDRVYFSGSESLPQKTIRYEVDPQFLGGRFGLDDELTIEPSSLKGLVSISYKSSNSKVLKIGPDGSAIVKGFGSTKVTATVKYNGLKKTASATMTFVNSKVLNSVFFYARGTAAATAPVKSAYIAIDARNLNLLEDLYIEPGSLSNQCEITWKSGNRKVAEVDQNGGLMLNGEGTAKITATVKYNGKKKTATITLKVYDPYKPTKALFDCGSKLTLYSNSIAYPLGTHLEIKAPVPDYSLYTVTYSSSKPSVVAVSDDGTLTPLKKGTAKITASVRCGTSVKKATCTVTVKAVPTELTGFIGKTFEELSRAYGENFSMTVYGDNKYLEMEIGGGKLNAIAFTDTGKIHYIRIQSCGLTLYGLKNTMTEAQVYAALKKKGFKNRQIYGDNAWIYTKGKVDAEKPAFIVWYADGLAADITCAARYGAIGN